MNLCSLPTTSIRVLFYFLIQIPLLLFEELENMLENIAPLNLVEDKKQFSVELDRWLYLFDAVSRYVDELNNTFGLILLIDLSWIFAKSIITFCEMILSYGFIVFIPLRFDLKRMQSDFLILDLHFSSISGITHTETLFFLNREKYFKSIVMLFYLNTHAYHWIKLKIVFLVLLWYRFLIILIPSNNMFNKVCI